MENTTAKKILILEDEEIILELLSKKLLQQGYEVRTAKNGKEGMLMMEKEIPDLVLTDVIMPEKDGFEVISEMKQNEALKNVPVMIISNSGQPVEIDKAKEMGVLDWVIKTEFDPQEIINKVNNILCQKS